MSKTYTVVCRLGTPEDFEWIKTTPVATREVAVWLRDRLSQLGHKALVHDTKAIDSIGVPDTWEYSR